jgi:hypothetical protein
MFLYYISNIIKSPHPEVDAANISGYTGSFYLTTASMLTEVFEAGF